MDRIHQYTSCCWWGRRPACRPDPNLLPGSKPTARPRHACKCACGHPSIHACRPPPPPTPTPHPCRASRRRAVPTLGLAWTHCVNMRLFVGRHDTPEGTRRSLQVGGGRGAGPAAQCRACSAQHCHLRCPRGWGMGFGVGVHAHAVGGNARNANFARPRVQMSVLGSLYLWAVPSVMVRSYLDENAPSHQHWEAKHQWARLVVRWVTTCETLVSNCTTTPAVGPSANDKP